MKKLEKHLRQIKEAENQKWRKKRQKKCRKKISVCQPWCYKKYKHKKDIVPSKNGKKYAVVNKTTRWNMKKSEHAVKWLKKRRCLNAYSKWCISPLRCTLLIKNKSVLKIKWDGSECCKQTASSRQQKLYTSAHNALHTIQSFATIQLC